eukprot:761498-Ditylum_brightwellii.AAC.1
MEANEIQHVGRTDVVSLSSDVCHPDWYCIHARAMCNKRWASEGVQKCRTKFCICLMPWRW